VIACAETVHRLANLPRIGLDARVQLVELAHREGVERVDRRSPHPSALRDLTSAPAHDMLWPIDTREAFVDGWVDQSEWALRTGVIVPAYFSAKPSGETVSHLLWMTLSDCHHYLPLEQVWVVVDGDRRTAGLAEDLRGQLQRNGHGSLNILPLSENMGKLGAIQAGMCALLAAHPRLQWIVIRDGDGDHMMSVTPQLVRTALFLEQAYGHSRVIVIGARTSRHRPMGFARGELESLLDQVTLDALAYVLARRGQALDLRHCLGHTTPDLSSGFKVYGRQIAESLFVKAEPRLLTLSESDYWHYGPETVTVIEAVLQGVVLAEALRPTWDGQPTTSFGEFRLLSLYGELLAWVFARLDIPIDVAACFFDRLVPGMTLRTTAEGRDLLDGLRRHALEKALSYRSEDGPIPPAAPLAPFV
jgi:hypothetical protein